jgi:hypothetical protein
MRGVAGDSYSEDSPVTSVPPDEPESAEKCEIRDEYVTQTEDWVDTDVMPRFGMVVKSIGLAAEAQRAEQEEMIRRHKRSPVSWILRRATEQPPQPEIIFFPDKSSSNSAIPSPRVSSDESDGEIQPPDPEKSNVVITGSGFVAQDEREFATWR